MDEFHFIRPLWLALLPVAVWAAWRIGLGRGGRDGWRAVVDGVLQPHVLTRGEGLTQRRWPVLTAVAAASFAAVALAGPAWDRLPVPAYRSDEALVVVLDLSRSMDAADVEPTRLARARLKLLDLLERREGGQTALVVFTAHAFTVTPLTNDTRTIAALVNALETDIMPSRGSLIQVGLDRAADLLRQSGASQGEILLITDATASPGAFDRVEELSAAGIDVSVLAVGTESGAPIPSPQGGFLTDDSGQVVVPQLAVDNLRRLAAAGGGRFARLAADDSDLDRLFARDSVGNVLADAGEDQREADVWRDQGIWLAVALLPLVALGFRRGWVYVLVAAVVLPAPRAEAFEWSDLWLNRDQQGAQALANDAPDVAAELFQDPEWAAAANYRAGRFEAAAAALAGIDTAEANYNRGNALARAGRLPESIAAYDRALELAPEHEDARFNRDLVAELLEQEEQQQQQQQADSGQQGDQGEQQQQQQGDGDEQQSGEQDQESGESGDPESQQMASRSEQDPSRSGESQQQQGADEAPPEREPGDSESERDGDSRDEPLQAAATPQDVEDWASEQAADQWLRRIPQDPGGLLRRKFRYLYQQYGVDQDGNTIFPDSAAEPW